MPLKTIDPTSATLERAPRTTNPSSSTMPVGARPARDRSQLRHDAPQDDQSHITMMNEVLENLLKNPRIWRGMRSANDLQAQGLPSGHAALDRHLPGGGWPREALTELLVEQHGRGELRLLMPALARLSRAGAGREEGWIAWIAPPFQPYPPALTQWGVDLSRVLVVHPKKTADILWSAEQALASGNCAAVLSWPQAMSDTASRRLQLAAEKGRSWAIVFRPSKARSEASAAALRLELVKGERGTDVIILKSRGGRPVRVRNVVHDHAG